MGKCSCRRCGSVIVAGHESYALNSGATDKYIEDHHFPFGQSATPDVNEFQELLYDLQVKTDGMAGDMFGPDGWNSEEHVYAHLSERLLMALHPHRITDFASSGDLLKDTTYLNGTGAVKAPRWHAASYFTDTRGDYSGDTEFTKRTILGVNIEEESWAVTTFHPYNYFLAAQLSNSGELYWLLNNFRSRQNYDDRLPMNDSDAHTLASLSTYYGEALEPLFCIFFDETISSVEPKTASAFFRDNDHATSDVGIHSEERYRNEDDVGTGGVFYLHNSPGQYDGSDKQMTVIYRVKHEWVSHGHEDSGHISLSRDDEAFWVDMGRSRTNQAPAYIEGQNFSHNVLLIRNGGDAPEDVVHYNSQTNSIYDVPSGGYKDEAAALMLHARASVAYGDHKNTWLLEATEDIARRYVVMIHDDNEPYAIVLTHVRDHGTARIFRENWVSGQAVSQSTTAAPTFSNPMTQTANMKSLYTFYANSGMDTPELASMEFASTGQIDVYRNYVETSSSVNEVVLASVHTGINPGTSGTQTSLTPNGGSDEGWKWQWSSSNVEFDVFAYDSDLSSTVSTYEARANGPLIWVRWDSDQAIPVGFVVLTFQAAFVDYDGSGTGHSEQAIVYSSAVPVGVSFRTYDGSDRLLEVTTFVSAVTNDYIQVRTSYDIGAGNVQIDGNGTTGWTYSYSSGIVTLTAN